MICFAGFLVQSPCTFSNRAHIIQRALELSNRTSDVANRKSQFYFFPRTQGFNKIFGRLRTCITTTGTDELPGEPSVVKRGVKVTMSGSQPCAHSIEAVVESVAVPEWALGFS